MVARFGTNKRIWGRVVGRGTGMVISALGLAELIFGLVDFVRTLSVIWHRVVMTKTLHHAMRVLLSSRAIDFDVFLIHVGLLMFGFGLLINGVFGMRNATGMIYDLIENNQRQLQSHGDRESTPTHELAD